MSDTYRKIIEDTRRTNRENEMDSNNERKNIKWYVGVDLIKK